MSESNGFEAQEVQQELSMRDLYGELQAGKKIVVALTDQEHERRFIAHLRSVRSKMEAKIKDIGFDEGTAKDELVFSGTFSRLEIKLSRKTYSYKILTIEDCDSQS